MLVCQNNVGTVPVKIQIRATDLFVYSFLEISQWYSLLLLVQHEYYTIKCNELKASVSLLYIQVKGIIQLF